jgi:hypothetical protein
VPIAVFVPSASVMMGAILGNIAPNVRLRYRMSIVPPGGAQPPHGVFGVVGSLNRMRMAHPSPVLLLHALPFTMPTKSLAWIAPST